MFDSLLATRRARKVKVGIINVTGYSGSELARILRRHPEVEIASVTGIESFIIAFALL